MSFFLYSVTKCQGRAWRKAMYDEKTIESISLKHFQSLIDAVNKPREQIAREVGLDASTITKYYNGDRHLSVSAIRKFANYFNVSSDYLLGLSNAPTNDKDLQAICDYTGLSEKAILNLRQYNIVDISIVENFALSKEDVPNTLKYMTAQAEENKQLISKFISSLAFEKVIRCSNDIQYVNNSLMSYLAIYFGDYEYFYKLHKLEERTIDTLYYFADELTHDNIHNALNDIVDLSVFQMQKSILSYFDALSNFSEFENRNIQLAFDWLRYVVWHSITTTPKEKNNIETIQKNIKEFGSQHFKDELSKLKEIYEKLKTSPKIE